MRIPGVVRVHRSRESLKSRGFHLFRFRDSHYSILLIIRGCVRYSERWDVIKPFLHEQTEA